MVEKHRDRIVITDYSDVTSPYDYVHSGVFFKTSELNDDDSLLLRFGRPFAKRFTLCYPIVVLSCLSRPVCL